MNPQNSEEHEIVINKWETHYVTYDDEGEVTSTRIVNLRPPVGTKADHDFIKKMKRKSMFDEIMGNLFPAGQDMSYIPALSMLSAIVFFTCGTITNHPGSQLVGFLFMFTAYLTLSSCLRKR